MSEAADLLEGIVAGDELGPDAVVILRHAPSGVSATVVIDNVAAGPAIGGLRMAPDISIGEVARLARAMTLKNAAAGLRHGGGKAGIAADPAMPRDAKEGVIRWFARAISELDSYIVGPDMGTDEGCMAWIHDEIGRSVGLPTALGGIPLDEIGATGLGLAVAADAAEAAGVLRVAGARVAVQGFGAVGQHTARFLSERGAVLVAAGDSRGGTWNAEGLDVGELIEWKRSGNALSGFGGGAAIDRDAVVLADCDILVPAARPDVITMANVGGVRAKLVLEGANIPISLEAEADLHGRGVLCLPDFIVNAGGVICASVEHTGGTREQALATITETIHANASTVIAGSYGSATLPRAVGDALALERVRAAAAFRRRF